MNGKAWKFGDDVNTDEIIPARYLNSIDPAELASHCMEDADPGFARKVRPGDVIVAGTNFGCGSSREHAPIAIKTAGVSCVIAKTFARIFFRNCINVGLPAIELDTDQINAGDELEVDLNAGVLQNLTQGGRIPFPRLPRVMTNILEDGGLTEHIRKHGDFRLT